MTLDQLKKDIEDRYLASYTKKDDEFYERLEMFVEVFRLAEFVIDNTIMYGVDASKTETYRHFMTLYEDLKKIKP